MNNQNQSLISQNQSLENQNQIVQSQIKESSNQIESLRRSVRVKSHIDYQEFHKTGVFKELSFEQGTAQENFEANQIHFSNENQENSSADVHEISTLLNNFSILSPPPKVADNTVNNQL